MKAATTCKYEGSEISAEEAITLRDTGNSKLYFSCIHCDEAVRIHKAGTNSLAHFEHYERNKFCPYSDGYKLGDDTFDVNDARAIEAYEVDKHLLSGARNSKLAKMRKAHDDYKCQSCDFKLKLNGKYVIECHHLNPIGQNGARETTLNDLISLCPTCHRIAHTRQSPLTIKEIISARKSL